jgi:hypothetical protein
MAAGWVDSQSDSQSLLDARGCEQSIHLVRCIPLHHGRNVRVEIECRANLGMTEAHPFASGKEAWMEACKFPGTHFASPVRRYAAATA